MDPIEEELQNGFRFLRFCPALEAQFERDALDERCKVMIVGNCIGLIVYHLFLFADYNTVHDAFPVDLFVHFAIMTPIVVALNLLLLRRPGRILREGAQTAGIIVLSLTVLTVVGSSQSPFRDLTQLTIIMIVLFATVMQRLPFWYSAAVCIAAQIFYSVGLAAITPFSMDRVVASTFVFAGIVIFSLVGCYNLEREVRTNYLLRLRDSIRNRNLEAISLQDALTGIGNRRALDARLQASARASLAEPERSTALLVLDIDHFKSFNDTNGHQSGDVCLTRIAHLIVLTLRHQHGTAYRFGGEEFVVVLDDTTLGAALEVAERIRTRVEQAAIPCAPDGDAVVTVSIGAAAGRLAQDATPNALIAEADGALYTAKRRGRNIVWPVAATSADAMGVAPQPQEGILRKAG